MRTEVVNIKQSVHVARRRRRSVGRCMRVTRPGPRRRFLFRSASWLRALYGITVRHVV